jgi:hypothetical protein
MKSDFIRFGFRLMRAGAFFAFALLGMSIGFWARAQQEDKAVLNYEHRITTVETKVDTLFSQIADLKQYLLYVLLGTAGLCGEAGVRLVKKKLPGTDE